MTAPRRIAVRAPTWIGDCVMATPALRSLRAGHPAAEIVAVCRPAVAELLAGHPAVDRFLVDDADGMRGLLRGARALRGGRFDLAVLFPDSPRAALTAWLAGIPRRVGFARDPLRAALVTERVSRAGAAPGGHVRPMETRYLRIAQHLECPDRGTHLDLVVADRDRESVRARLRAVSLPEASAFVLVTPGAGFGKSKEWPPAHFAAACDALSRELGLPAVVAPGPAEAAIANAIVRAARERLWVLSPRSLGELKALVERASLVLTNDTGPRHIASALGRPAVVLMGPTDPEITDGNAERQRVLREAVPCSPCQRRVCPIDHRCMTRLRPERVLDAAAALLREQRLLASTRGPALVP